MKYTSEEIKQCLGMELFATLGTSLSPVSFEHNGIIVNITKDAVLIQKTSSLRLVIFNEEIISIPEWDKIKNTKLCKLLL
jgi:hypothetical protein